MMTKGTYLPKKLKYHADRNMEKGNNFDPKWSVFNDDQRNILVNKAGVSC